MAVYDVFAVRQLSCIVIDLNGIAQRTEEPRHAKPGEEWIPQQHSRSNPIISLQDYRLSRR